MFDAEFAEFQKLLNNNKQEDGVVARFYDRPVKTSKVDTNGLPIFENRCFVEIRIKDNNSDIWDQPADNEKIQRFPVEYARYQLAKKQSEKGAPLEQFAFLTAAEIESLKHRGIFTVEALAELASDKVANLGLEKEKELAEKFLQANAGNYSIAKMEEKENEYKKVIEGLTAELEKAKAEIEKLKAEKANKVEK